MMEPADPNIPLLPDSNVGEPKSSSVPVPPLKISSLK